MSHWFQLGGFAMWFTLLFGVLAIGASARYAMGPARRLVPLVAGFGTLTMLSGGFGLVTGLVKSLNAIPRVAPDQRWIWLVGLGESLVNIALALALVGISTMILMVGAWRLAARETAVRESVRDSVRDSVLED